MWERTRSKLRKGESESKTVVFCCQVKCENWSLTSKPDVSSPAMSFSVPVKKEMIYRLQISDRFSFLACAVFTSSLPNRKCGRYHFFGSPYRTRLSQWYAKTMCNCFCPGRFWHQDKRNSDGDGVRKEEQMLREYSIRCQGLRRKWVAWRKGKNIGKFPFCIWISSIRAEKIRWSRQRMKERFFVEGILPEFYAHFREKKNIFSTWRPIFFRPWKFYFCIQKHFFLFSIKRKREKLLRSPVFLQSILDSIWPHSSVQQLKKGGSSGKERKYPPPSSMVEISWNERENCDFAFVAHFWASDLNLPENKSIKPY